MSDKYKAGQKVGDLLLIKKTNKYRWLCKCDCGNPCEITWGILNKIVHPHCGCKNNYRKGMKVEIMEIMAGGERLNATEIHERLEESWPKRSVHSQLSQSVRRHELKVEIIDGLSYYSLPTNEPDVIEECFFRYMGINIDVFNRLRGKMNGQGI